MEPAIPVLAVIGTIAASVIVVRFAAAFAKRLERRPPAVPPPDPAIGELRDALDVLPQFRRRGIGTALCGTVERNATARGVHTLYLFTLDKQPWYGALDGRLSSPVPGAVNRV